MRMQISTYVNPNLLELAEKKKLWRVEEGEVLSISRAALQTLRRDDEYGRSWILVEADTATDALAIAKAYDDPASLWKIEDFAAVQAIKD